VYGFVFVDNSILMDSYRNHMNTSKIVVNAYRHTKCATETAYRHSKYENVAPIRPSVTGSNGGDGLIRGQFGNLWKKQKFWLDNGKNLIEAA
jgi:hypothetical protein